jgi:hypothetical protein
LGSGRTWPQDFRFLAGFFSDEVAVDGVEGSSSSNPWRMAKSGDISSAYDCGVMISRAVIVVVVDGAGVDSGKRDV